MNLCRSCNEDFSSVEAFDRHRVGVHEYTFLEGLEQGREDGRRCLSIEELEEIGFEVNDRGRWHDPTRTERARELLSHRA